MYHSIDDTGPETLAPYRVAPPIFESHLRLLAERGYESVSLETWSLALETQVPLSKRSVIITFDDGYRNFLVNAWPLLERFGFTATLFIVTDKVGLTADWDGEAGRSLPLLTWHELRLLRDRGVSIGSHTATHPWLTRLSTPDIIDEGTRARDRLRHELGLDVTTIAFPWGNVDERVCNALAQAGYRTGVRTWGGLSTLQDEALSLPRIEIFPDDGPAIFEKKINERGSAMLDSDTALSTAAAAPLSAIESFAGTPMTPKPENPLQLAAQLDRLIGQFVSLSMQLLALPSAPKTVQTKLSGIFREPLTGTVSRELNPYEKLASGLCVGFEQSARVTLMVQPKVDFGLSPEDCLNTVCIDLAGSSRWLSLEFACDWQELTAITRFQLGIYCSVSRTLAGRAVLRLPTRGDSVVDVVLAEYTLSPDRRNTNQSGSLPAIDYISLDLTRPPTLLFDVNTTNLADLELRLDYLSLFFD